MRVWAGAAVLVAALAVAAFSWGSRPVVRHETTAVVRTDVETTVAAIGTLQPRRYVDVGAQVSGLITKLHVTPGSQVRKGELMVEIDPSVQQATVDAARAQLAGLRAQLADQQAQHRLATQQLARQQQMAAEGSTRLEDVQVSEASAASAAARIEHLLAQIAQTQAALKADEARLGYTRIYAPMDGTVVSVQAREGQTLNATYQTPDILRVADLSAMTVWTEVSEADVRRVRAGLSVYFTTLGGETDAPRRWQGEVRQVLPAPPSAAQGAQGSTATATATKAVTYVVLFDVDNSDGELMPQMTAQVTFVVAAARGVLAVPLSALSASKDEGQQVRVLTPRGEPELRAVKVGTRSRHLVEIVDGLAEGEAVIVGERTESRARRFQW